MKITLKNWLMIYQQIIDERVQYNDIKPKTAAEYHLTIKRCLEYWPDKYLHEITVFDIATAIRQISASGTLYAARRFRLNMSNLFIEAQREGYIAYGHNPASVTRQPRTFVKTERLSFDEWKIIYNYAKNHTPIYFQLSMILALVTAQRISDVIKFHHDDIYDGYLHITQYKTGTMIAIPLNLKLDALNLTLHDVIEMCCKTGYLLQHKNKQIKTWRISRLFKECRNETLHKEFLSTFPPSFREQRSLSERLYRQQRVDTKTLLGHKYQQMTDNYDDERGKEYKYLSINKENP